MTVTVSPGRRLGTVAIDDRCTACGACLATCPERALRRAPRRPRLLADRCTGCLACLEVCPVDAVTPMTALGPRREDRQ